MLELFPQDLLDSNKKVKPVDVKIIEHDGYIDYEIEFVELSEYDEQLLADYGFVAYPDEPEQTVFQEGRLSTILQTEDGNRLYRRDSDPDNEIKN